MLLADTHMLGPFKGHWFDKLRREWQMHRAFQTAITLFNPEIVFMLGDIFDEGNWVNSSQFDDYHARFNRLFYVPETTRLYAVVGNHDVGFHYATYPYLIDRFDRAFNTSVVELITEKNIHFVTINSMAMEQDNCSLCKEAEKALKVISNQLNCYKGTGKNCKNVKQKSYSQPIVLQVLVLFI